MNSVLTVQVLIVSLSQGGTGGAMHARQGFMQRFFRVLRDFSQEKIIFLEAGIIFFSLWEP